MAEKSATKVNELWARIYRVVDVIPAGKVATYGQVAEAAGLPRQARLVGYALNGVGENTELPWHRIVNAKGQSSLDDFAGGASIQRALLEQEGVVFDDNARIDLVKFRCKFDMINDAQRLNS